MDPITLLKKVQMDITDHSTGYQLINGVYKSLDMEVVCNRNVVLRIEESYLDTRVPISDEEKIEVYAVG